MSLFLSWTGGCSPSSGSMGKRSASVLCLRMLWRTDSKLSVGSQPKIMTFCFVNEPFPEPLFALFQQRTSYANFISGSCFAKFFFFSSISRSSWASASEDCFISERVLLELFLPFPQKSISWKAYSRSTSSTRGEMLLWKRWQKSSFRRRKYFLKRNEGLFREFFFKIIHVSGIDFSNTNTGWRCILYQLKRKIKTPHSESALTRSAIREISAFNVFSFFF